MGVATALRVGAVAAMSRAVVVAATAALAGAAGATSRVVVAATVPLVGVAAVTMTARLAAADTRARDPRLGKAAASLVAAPVPAIAAAMTLVAGALATGTGVVLLLTRPGRPVASKVALAASAATATSVASGPLTHPSLFGKASPCATKASLRCPAAPRASATASLLS